MRWKSTFLILIHKHGTSYIVECYRSIAKLKVSAKLFDRIATQKLGPAVKSHISPFSRCQVFSSGSHSNVVYIDFSKTFDLVDYKLLIYKFQTLWFLSIPIARDSSS